MIFCLAEGEIPLHKVCRFPLKFSLFSNVLSPTRGKFWICKRISCWILENSYMESLSACKYSTYNKYSWTIINYICFIRVYTDVHCLHAHELHRVHARMETCRINYTCFSRKRIKNRLSEVFVLLSKSYNFAVLLHWNSHTRKLPIKKDDFYVFFHYICTRLEIGFFEGEGVKRNET